MQVKNDFPNVDKVIRKLKDYVKFFSKKLEKETDEEKKEDYEYALKQVDEFIKAMVNYLDSVCNGEKRIEEYQSTSRELSDIQDFIQDEDSARTRYHSQIIASMVSVDRCAELEGLDRVFDYAEEFQKDYSRLTVNNRIEKNKMTERERVKRREMGNFALYIAASLTAGMHKEHMISDDEAREFAACDTDDVKTTTECFRKVKDTSNTFKRNIESVIE